MGIAITQEEPEQKYFSYKKIPLDKEGWVANNGPKPRNYDLVTLKVTSIYGIKNISGWWSGTKWTGLRLSPRHTVLKWQRKELK